MSDLTDRLRGNYKVGPEGIYGTRSFAGFFPPICTEAAERIDALEAMLVELRHLLAAQENKECLGVGRSANEDCAPWPLVDEAINSITMALIDT